MPLINSDPTSFDKEMELLNAVGVSTGRKGSVENRFSAEMLNGGLGPEEIVATIGGIMNAGENSSVKLAAAKLALAMFMHPAFVPSKERERQEAPVINISIAGGNVQLANVLRPIDSYKEPDNA